jgi:hypothetical protein
MCTLASGMGRRRLLRGMSRFEMIAEPLMSSSARLSRREALALLGAAGISAVAKRAPHTEPQQALASTLDGAVMRNDAAVHTLLSSQITDSSSVWRGSVPDQFGLHSAGSAGGVAETLTASFLHPRSTFHADNALVDRLRLAAGFLERAQSPQGNIDLLTTNFNSPPDTGFVVHNVATAAATARLHGHDEIVRIFQPFLTRAGAGMEVGGIHTPNHRWVVSSALAQINELFPDARYVRRIDKWLAEGIDIDTDGQFTERSTLVYNIVTDRALIVLASKLRRPELLDPVRQNLAALQYLLHADGEVVTEISRRQDQFTRGAVTGYWFPLTYMALRTQDGRLSTLAARAASDGARLSALLEYPELSQPLPAPQSLPEDFEKAFDEIGIARIRRGRLSASLILGGSSRFFTLHYGDAVVEGVRFATSFFGKGQFVPQTAVKRETRYEFRQSLEGPYFQPLEETITTRTWEESRRRRQQSEVCRLEQSADVTEMPGGFNLRLRASGTIGVPVSMELTFREGGQLEGCRPIAEAPGTFLLEQGTGTYRVGRYEIRFGAGDAPHRYTQLRGAEPRLPGLSVYLTGYTPFDRTISLDCRG